MRRLPAALCALAALAPAALVLGAVSRLPASAFVVPSLRIAGVGKPVAITPQALGARRTARGFEIRADRLDRALRELATASGRPPRPGAYVRTEAGVVLQGGIPGVELDLAEARRRLVAALRGNASEVTLPLREIPPPPPPPYAIIVRLSELRLDLYQGTRLLRQYPVGVGQLRFPTPPGVYHIRSKAKNPAWINPGSAWARGMPRYIPPGPRNPLGTRALRLDRGALVIHGTPQPWTVGRRSSHGCIRMRREHVEELFDMVPVGTPVFIFP